MCCSFFESPFFSSHVQQYQLLRVKFAPASMVAFIFLYAALGKSFFHYCIIKNIGTKNFLHICFHNYYILSCVFFSSTITDFYSKIKNIKSAENPCDSRTPLFSSRLNYLLFAIAKYKIPLFVKKCK